VDKDGPGGKFILLCVSFTFLKQPEVIPRFSNVYDCRQSYQSV